MASLHKLIWIIILSLYAIGTLVAQVRIADDAKYLPPNFDGADPVLLVNNLIDTLSATKVLGKSNSVIENAVRNKLIYGGATVDDKFFLKPKISKSLSATDANASLNVFRAQAYRLIDKADFPEPIPYYTPSCGSGSGNGGSGVSVTNPNQLVDDFGSLSTIESIWLKSTISLKTVWANENGKNYNGTSGSTCQNTVFVVSPQIHYEIGFNRSQPFRLIEVSEKAFSLKTYGYEDFIGPGIAAFLPNSSLYSFGRPESTVDPDIVFVVKLVPPYVKTETVSMFDSIEKRPNVAIRKSLVVDLVGIWRYDRITGQILSKDAGQPVDLKSYKLEAPNRPYGITQPFKIISKPRPAYTSEAKALNIQGTVVLRVTFLASGQIGQISSVKGLPNGLTDQAIAAARRIQFEPAKINGVATTVTKIISFTFTTIY